MSSQNEFKVNDQASLGLNLRSEPDPSANNILAVIPHGHNVTKLEESSVPNWWKVQTTLDGTTQVGFVNKKFLSPEGDVHLEEHQSVTPVHLPTAGHVVTRNGTLRAFPLTETPPVERDPNGTPEQRVSAIRQLINWFGVESNQRYQAGGGATFCNIYAYDYCFMTGAYLPRVWWTAQSILKLKAGQSVPVQYPGTVNELSANSLSDWFNDWAPDFGWRRTLDLTELQDAANQGHVCITVGRAKQQFHHGHGHIVAVVPETDPFRAMRQGGQVIKTVQSQAGAHNHEYVVQRWWDDGTYANFSHWIHE